MATTMKIDHLLLRNDTAAQWASVNPVLSKGEIGIESDTHKFKFGDGVSTWDKLSYAGTLVSASDTNGNVKIDGVETTVYTLPVASDTALGGVKSGGNITVDEAGAVTVNSAAGADKLNTPHDIALTGEVTGTASFDGSADATITTTVTSIDHTKVNGLGSAALVDTGAAAGNVPVLDENGKLVDSVIPALAIGETTVVASEAEMLALTAQKGDIAVRSDVSKTYILGGDDPKVLDSWIEFKTPASDVTSVNGKTGVVSLASTDLTDTSDLVYKADVLTLDCGNASGNNA